MKRDDLWLLLHAPLLLVLGGVAVLALTGCSTIEHPDGTKETRFDGATARQVLDTGFETWDQYERRRDRYPYSPSP